MEYLVLLEAIAILAGLVGVFMVIVMGCGPRKNRDRAFIPSARYAQPISNGSYQGWEQYGEDGRTCNDPRRLTWEPPVSTRAHPNGYSTRPPGISFADYGRLAARATNLYHKRMGQLQPSYIFAKTWIVNQDGSYSPAASEADILDRLNYEIDREEGLS